MRIRLAALVALVLVSSAGVAQDRGGPGKGGAEHGQAERGRQSESPRGRARANPTAVIASEIALNRLVREKGEWKALLELAAPGAELFVPERVTAADWLKKREEPEVATRRDPYAAWMSCDASRGAVYGGWSQDGEQGRFVSLWQRNEKGGYNWLRRFSFAVGDEPDAPDMISARVADCPKAESGLGDATVAAEGDARQDLESKDRSLRWTWAANAGGQPRVELRIWKDGEFATVFTTGDEAAE